MSKLPDIALNRTRVHPPSSCALLLAGGAVASWPPDAHAQKIPWIVVPLAATPVVAVLLCVVLGIVTRSWVTGLAHTILVILWVAWFLAASNYSTSDPLIWASMVALALHCLVMIGLIVSRALRRTRPRNEA